MKSIGKGYSETKAFSYLAKVSNEKERQLELIQKNIKDIKKDFFLDIGAGSGDVFFPLSTMFKKSVAIEPGEKMFLILKQQQKNYKNIKLYKKTWQDFYNNKKNKQKYDLIILVHVIYFFEDVKEDVKKIISLLNKNGKLIIICGSGSKLRKREFKTRFTSYFRHKFLGDDPSYKPYYNLLKWFPKMTCNRFKCKLILRNLKYLEKDYLSKENAPTNYFFKFIFKRWWDEYSKEEKKMLKDYLKRYLIEDKEYYIVPNYDQRIYVYKK